MKKEEKAVNLSEREALVEVSTTVLKHTKVKRKRLQIRPFVTNPAVVSVKLGATIPTGDFSSVRVDVMISSPCYVEEVEKMFIRVRNLVDELLQQEVERLTEGEM